MKSIVCWYAWAGLLLLTAQCLADDHIPWVADFRTACGMAAEQRRLVLLHFYNDNCGPCVRLEQNVFSKPEVGEAVAQNYLAVKVHAGKEPQLASRYRVNQWPTDVFVTPSGLEVHRAVSDQNPAKYIAVLNQVAQQTGVSAGRQWKSQLSQTSQNVAAAANGAVNQASGEANRFAQRAGSEYQVAADKAQQQWNQAGSQFRETAGQARTATQESLNAATQTAKQVEQQASATATQAKDQATQWGQQATAAAQKYQEQAGESYRHFREQADGTRQEIQHKMDVAKQEWRESTQKATQPLNDAAGNLKNQWQQLGQSLPDRRSAFIAADPSPAAATAQVAAAQVATVAPNNGGASVAPASALQPAPSLPTQQATEQPIMTVQTPQATENPWFTNRKAKGDQAPLTSARPADSPAIASAPAVSAPPLLPAVPQQEPPSPQTPPQQQHAQQPVARNLPLVPASQAPPLALDGFCPVTLLETMAKNSADRAAWKKGDRLFGAIHRGRTYLFADATQQQKFLANPDGFAPALAGCDPVRLAERGEWVDGKRAYGIVTPDQRILLFADEASRNRFEQSPGTYTSAIQQAVARSESGSAYR